MGEDLLFQAEGARLGGGYRLTMPGLFNVDNALAAIALCQGLGLPPEAVRVTIGRCREHEDWRRITIEGREGP